MKFLSNSLNKGDTVNGYLLVAGGFNPKNKEMTSNVKLYEITLKFVSDEYSLKGKLVFEDDIMQESDFFPHN